MLVHIRSSYFDQRALHPIISDILLLNEEIFWSYSVDGYRGVWTIHSLVFW